MKSEVVYKNVRIENISLSDAAKKITHRNILVLMDGVETYFWALSLAKAKIVIDAVVACGVEIKNGRLVLSDGQFSELSRTTDNPQVFSFDEWAHIMKVGA
jgi:hypothetical protein